MRIRIKQVSEQLDVPVSTIRYWQQEFAAFVEPQRSKGGQRIYADRELKFFRFIKMMVNEEHKSLEQIKETLRRGELRSDPLDWSQLTILVTGGTGSFGRCFCKTVLQQYNPKVLRVFSRDELKQSELQQELGNPANVRFFLGDVRDRERLYRAMEGVDVVVHAAALKQVPACEYNPFEAVKTNIHGAQNIIDAAIDCRVGRIIALSTDKAVNPVNLYGATKLCADKLFIQGNSYSGDRNTRFSCVRYGNVVGSRGSVIPLFQRQKERGVLTVTDRRMTRFWITLEQAVETVIKSLAMMKGGEIFIPRIPSMRIVDLARAIAPEAEIREIGIRTGEKLHEVLMTEDDSRNAAAVDGMYIIKPGHPWWEGTNFVSLETVPEGFIYASDTNEQWLSVDELHAQLGVDPLP